MHGYGLYVRACDGMCELRYDLMNGKHTRIQATCFIESDAHKHTKKHVLASLIAFVYCYFLVYWNVFSVCAWEIVEKKQQDESTNENDEEEKKKSS